jgi:hypothetical protein
MNGICWISGLCKTRCKTSTRSLVDAPFSLPLNKPMITYHKIPSCVFQCAINTQEAGPICGEDAGNAALATTPNKGETN